MLLFERFEPEAVLAAAAHEATMFFGVPTMYERLVAAEGCERLGHLRLCVSGSAPLAPSYTDESSNVALRWYSSATA